MAHKVKSHSRRCKGGKKCVVKSHTRNRWKRREGQSPVFIEPNFPKKPNQSGGYSKYGGKDTGDSIQKYLDHVRDTSFQNKA